MQTSKFGIELVYGVALSCVVAVIPARADDHDHAGDKHGHLTEKDIAMPKDYASAVARLKKCRITLEQEVAAGHLEDADTPLDEATIILDKLMPLARDSGIPKAQWQEVNVAAKDLKKRFDDLHGAIERKRKFDFKTAAPPIDQALRRLETVARAPAGASSR